MHRKLSALVCLLFTVAGRAGGTPQASPHPEASTLSQCQANQLSLGTDDEGGNFNGMSHSGTLVVLRNLGPNACRVAPFAAISLRDAANNIPVTFTVPNARGLHPGPVVLPIILASGAELTATLRWVSGPVFTASSCYQAAQISVDLPGGKLTSALTANLCAEKGKPVAIERTRFAPDPIYSPRSSTALSTP